MSFHDDAIRFMQELLIKLQNEATSEKSGTAIAEETAEDVLLRLIGLIRSPEIQVDGQNINESDAPAAQQTTPNLIDSFFKTQLGATTKDLSTINTLLKAYRTRLNRYSKARTQIKLNRINQLIQVPANPLNVDDLVKDNPEDTRAAVSTALGKLEDNGDLTGILQQEITANEAVASSIDEVTAGIPSNVGDFGAQFVSLLRATGKEAFDNIEQLNTTQSTYTKQADALTNEKNLLFTGEDTFNGNVKLSLLKVLNVLIFLTDRQQMKYNCSQCQFFQAGDTNACTFAPQGLTAKTPAVTVTDDQGNQVDGRLTRPTNSCKEVWGLDNNDYYTPSDSIVQSIKKALEDN